jgi:hypothetical protein
MYVVFNLSTLIKTAACESGEDHVGERSTTF